MEKLEETFLQNLEKMTDFVDRIENDLASLKSFINLQKIKYSSRRESQDDENDFLRIEAYYSTNHHEGPSTATATSTSNVRHRQRQQYPYNYNNDEDFDIYNAADEEEEVDNNDNDDRDPLEPDYLDDTDHDYDVKPQMSNYLPSMLEKQSQNLNYQRKLCDSLNASISHPPKRIQARNQQPQPKYVYETKKVEKFDVKKTQEYKNKIKMKTIFCPEPGCKFKALGYFNMRTHVINRHPFSNHPVYPVWRCEICDFFAMFKTKLIDHMKKKHKQEVGFKEKLKALEFKFGRNESVRKVEALPPRKKKKVIPRPQLTSIETKPKIKSDPNLQEGGETIIVIQNPKYPSLSLTRTLRGKGRPKKIQILDNWTRPTAHSQKEIERAENFEITNLSLSLNSSTNTTTANTNENIEEGSGTAETSNYNDEEQNTTIQENESTNEIAISRNIMPSNSDSESESDQPLIQRLWTRKFNSKN